MKSRAGYWLGGALMVVAVAGAGLWVLLSLSQTNDTVQGFQRIDVPGTAMLSLDAGKHIVYVEGDGVDVDVPGIDITVAGESPEAPVVETYDGSLTYSFNEFNGSALGTVSVPESGDYEVQASAEDDTRELTLAVGESIAGSIIRTVLGALVIAGTLGLAGLALVIVTAVRRSRGRAPSPQPAAGAG